MMRKILNKVLHRLFRQEEGAALIEFALIAPVFIFFIFAVLQLSIVLVIDNALETSIREAARYGITGQGSSARDNQIRSRIQTIAQDYSGGLINPNGLIITINSYSNFPALDNNTSASSSSGSGNQAVKYQVQYTWDTVMPILGTSHLVTLKAETPVMNEDFES